MGKEIEKRREDHVSPFERIKKINEAGKRQLRIQN